MRSRKANGTTQQYFTLSVPESGGGHLARYSTDSLQTVNHSFSTIWKFLKVCMQSENSIYSGRLIADETVKLVSCLADGMSAACPAWQMARRTQIVFVKYLKII